MRPLAPFAGAALAALLLALAAPLLPRAPFSSYFAGVPPVAAVALATALGTLALLRLHAIGWAAPGWPSGRTVLAAFGLGAGLALATVGLDSLLPFPADINAPLPEALAFYPVMGLVAAIAMQLVPLALLSYVAPRAFWAAAALAALAEPGFQLWAGGTIGLRDTVMAAILIVFGLASFAALRRGGFLALFALRLGYYLVWHVLWGAARLPLLFSA